MLRRAQAGVQLRIAGYHPDSLGGVRFLDPDGAHRTRGIRDGVRKARRGLRFAGSGLEGVKRFPGESQPWEIAGDEKQPAAPSHGYQVELTTSTGRPLYVQVVLTLHEGDFQAKSYAGIATVSPSINCNEASGPGKFRTGWAFVAKNARAADADRTANGQ